MEPREVIDGMEPFCSIVIPTRNRPQKVRACVECLMGLDYPRDRYEVIVVDDGSVRPVEVEGAKLIRQPPAGPAKARNAGAQVARGELVAFTDDDCYPDVGWLRAAVDAWRRYPNDLLGGPVTNALANNPWAEASQTLVSYLYDYYSRGAAGPRFFTTNNVALGRRRFLELGGFDEALPRAAAEDREFCDRWLHAGYRLRFVPGMVVHHAHNLNASRFWQQHFNYGRGAHYYHVTRARRWNEGLRVEPWSFYVGLLRYPWNCHRGARAMQLMALLVVAQVANALGFFWERLTQWNLRYR
ncbi:MAG: glycosyltransferase [Verrucomicrobiae bacterium]|nr:glycosyltransferase [Verrucomicrobiae bacterium]MDW8343036.1 glycosyltransferase [Verrucomicrobiae bacterium]